MAQYYLWRAKLLKGVLIIKLGMYRVFVDASVARRPVVRLIWWVGQSVCIVIDTMEIKKSGRSVR